MKTAAEQNLKHQTAFLGEDGPFIVRLMIFGLGPPNHWIRTWLWADIGDDSGCSACGWMELQSAVERTMLVTVSLFFLFYFF